MNIKKLKKTISGISEKTKNRELLEKILNEAKLSRSETSKMMVYQHSSSFDHYVYRYKEENFPGEFSYLFLNAVFSSLYLKDIKNIKNQKKSLEYFKENKNKLWHKQKDDFVNLIIKCSEKGIVKKLIVPALEFHALNLIKLGNFESKEVRESFVESYLRTVCSEAYDYIEDSDNENFQEQLPTKKYNQYLKLIDNLRNFFPIIEILRHNFLQDFLAPHEYKKINIINSKTQNGKTESMVLSKEFLRYELGLFNLDNIFMLKILDDNMSGTFETNDKVLIKKHPNYIAVEKKKKSQIKSYKFKDGIYAIEIPEIIDKDTINKKFIIRRLQFSYPSKSWSEQLSDIDNNEIPKFLEEEANREINKVFEKGIENVKLFEIDKLVNKYGVGNPLLVKKLKPLINLEESQDDYFFGKKIMKENINLDVSVNIINDNKKYPPFLIKLDDLQIVGEVLWKSSKFKNLDKEILFNEKIPDTLDILFNKDQLKEIA